MKNKANKNFFSHLDYMEIEDIVKNIKNGNEEAKNLLTEKYMPLIKCLISKLQVNGYLKEDLINESYVTLFKILNKYIVGMNTFVGYSVECIKKNLYDLVRRSTSKDLNFHKHLPELLQPLEDYSIQDVEDSLHIKFIMKQLALVINELSKEEKDLFFNIILKNSSLREYAQVINCSSSTVAYRRDSLRKKLKEEIYKYMN